jgi:hypothetical protein
MKDKYKIGDVVNPVASPTLKLMVRRHADKIYHCMIYAHPNRKELIYFEKELVLFSEKSKIIE